MANLELKAPLLGNTDKSMSATGQEVEMRMKMNPLLGDLFKTATVSDSRSDVQNILRNLTKMKPQEIQIPFKGNCLVMTQDKSSLVFISVEGRLGICNRLTKEVTNDVQLPGGGLYALALSQNDKYIFCGGKEAVIRKYQLSDFKCVGQLKGHTNKISEIVFSPDEKWLYSCSDDSMVMRWDMATETSEVMYQHSDRALTMDMTKDGKMLVTGGADRVVIVYDLENNQVIQTLTGNTNTVWTVRLSKSGSMIAGGDNDGGCLIWSTHDWSLIKQLVGHTARVSCIDFLDNERTIVTASNDKTVRIWSLVHDRNEVVYTGHLNWIKSMMMADDQRSVYTVSEDCRILIWKIPQNMDSEIRLSGHTENIYNVLYSEKRNLFYTNANDKKAIVWDAIKRVKVRELLHNDGVYAMCMAPDGDFLITCTAGKQVVMWNLDTYEPHYITDFEDVVIKSICSTPDGKYFITGDTAQRITVTEYRSPLISNERPVKYVFRKHKKTVWSCTTTHDSSVLFTGGEDGSIVLYDLNIGAEIGILLGHTKKIKCLAVSRNDEILISGSWDATFKIWSIKKQFLYKTITFHTAAINQIYFSKDEEYFIVASTDTKVSFWNYHDFSFITVLPYKELVVALNLSPDEKTMYVVEKTNIYVQENPMCTSTFAFHGPEKDYFGYLSYIDKLINGEPVEHDPEMDKWLIAPMRWNAVHLYAYFNLPSHLKAAFRASSPIYNSVTKRNPLSLSVEREFTDCVNAILGSLNKKVTDSPQSLYLLEDLIIQLNQNGYSMLDELYGCLFICSRDTTLPKFVDSTVALPIIAHSGSTEVNTDIFLTKDMFKSEGKSIQFWQTNIKFDMSLGSSESISFLQSIVDCPNTEIFRTKFIKVLLEEKWKSISWIMKVQGIIYAVYLLLLAIYTVNFMGSLPFLAPIFVINLFLMIYEFFQMALCGVDYWTDVWNDIDIIRGTVFVLYSVLLIIGEYSDFNDTVLVILTLLSWIRGITYFRLFEETRYMIDLLNQVFADMVSFLVLLFYSTIAFALIFVAINKGQGDNFSTYLTTSYRLDLGDFDTGDYNIVEWTIFFLASMINPLIMLNLLISIMGDTYDRVQDGREIADRKELAEMILEGETLLYWRRTLGQKLYVQMCTEQEQLTQNDSWMGKVRELKLRLVQVNKSVNQHAQQQSADIKRIEAKVDALTAPDNKEILAKIDEANKATTAAIEALKAEHETQIKSILKEVKKLAPA